MNQKTKKILILPSVCFIAMSVWCSTATANCSNDEHRVKATKINQHNWKLINDNYSDPKQAIFFHDDKGCVVKIKAGYKHPIHHYEHDIMLIIIEGDLHITVGSKTTDYSKGAYITIPANTCFSSFSKKGAMVALLGAKPGESKNSQ